MPTAASSSSPREHARNIQRLPMRLLFSMALDGSDDDAGGFDDPVEEQACGFLDERN